MANTGLEEGQLESGAPPYLLSVPALRTCSKTSAQTWDPAPAKPACLLRETVGAHGSLETSMLPLSLACSSPAQLLEPSSEVASGWGSLSWYQENSFLAETELSFLVGRGWWPLSLESGKPLMPSEGQSESCFLLQGYTTHTEILLVPFPLLAAWNQTPLALAAWRCCF